MLGGGRRAGAGRAWCLEPDEPLPADFSYPAVLKPVDGAGSQDTYLVSGPHDAPPAYAWPRRLERYVPGLAASVAVLCGPAGRHCADAVQTAHLGRRPVAVLGRRVAACCRSGGTGDRHWQSEHVAALPSTIGYVGVDLVLGREPHGSEDAVIEVNPRLTTSYVGLRAAAQANLAEAMWRIAQGELPADRFCQSADRIRCERQCEFHAMSWLAFDIGGANLKAADGRGWAQIVPFALWKYPDRLAFGAGRADRCRAADRANRRHDDRRAVRLFCHEGRRRSAHLDAAAAAGGGRDVAVYLVDGRLVSIEEARDSPHLAAASNWHALARFACRFVSGEVGLLIDIGSTTTDIVPLVDGEPRPQRMERYRSAAGRRAGLHWRRADAHLRDHTVAALARAAVPCCRRAVCHRGRCLRSFGLHSRANGRDNDGRWPSSFEGIRTSAAGSNDLR